MCNIASSALGYVLDMTSFNSLTLVNRLLNSTCIYFLEISDTALLMKRSMRHSYTASNIVTRTVNSNHLNNTVQFSLLDYRCLKHGVTSICFVIACVLHEFCQCGNMHKEKIVK